MEEAPSPRRTTEARRTALKEEFMLRSLFTGVSGVIAQQQYMDVIANNISNANTTGYKSNRITFADTFAATLSGASGSTGTYGGTNPMQIGLGVRTSGIQTNFTQGTLNSTGIDTDLGINGDGFFIVNDGAKNYYTRAGDFQVNADGELLTQSGAAHVMGRIADANGNLTSTTNLEEILLPYGQKDPAKATENVTLFCNLNKNASSAEEYLAESKLTLKTGSGTVTSTTNLNSITGFSLDTGSGPITISGTDSAGNAVSGSFTYGTDGVTLGDLMNKINTAFGSSTTTGATMSLDPNGYLRFKANQFGESSLSIALNAPAETTGTAALVTAGTAYTTGGGTTPATLTTDLATLDGVTIADGNTITISGVTPSGATVNTTFTYGASNNGTTVQDLLNRINSAFSGASASLDATGRVVLTAGASGSASPLALTIADGTSAGLASAFTLTDGVNATNVTPPNFGENVAGKTGTHSTTITVYDSMGESHELEIRFTQDATPGSNSWSWQAVVDGGTTVPSSGGSGTVTFNSDGTLNSFNFDGGASAIKFDAAGAQQVSIAIKPGSTGGVDGITQYAAASTTTAIEQDGRTMGTLNDISIDSSGIITGSYSNGQSRVLAQVALATFDNQGGLMKDGDNLWAASAASGDARTEWAGVNNTTKIQSGYLENSNVDLTTQFADMIIAERAIQANAKVMSTSDNILTTVIQQLKRT
jgi:flagellar hook protein FlgE